MSEGQATEAATDENPNLVGCRICAAKIYVKAETCPHCGADFPGLSEDERQRAASPKPRKARENDYAKGYAKGRFGYELAIALVGWGILLLVALPLFF